MNGEAGSDTGDAYVAKADEICSGMIADSRHMVNRFMETPHPGVDSLTLTTQELVKPAIPILERSARRLRALKQKATSVKFDSYVTLFDPIVSLARDRVRAGEAGDTGRAHTLELLLVELSTLQRSLAREAGLKTCDVDFIEAFSSPKGL